MDWPKLPDGSIDWMSLFQAPDTGLISMIGQADTSEKLRTCFTFLIETLFARDDDAEIRQRYFDIVEETFHRNADQDRLAAEKVKIRLVMTRVMNDRIKRSREYAATKAAKKSALRDSRRAGQDDLTPLAV